MSPNNIYITTANQVKLKNFFVCRSVHSLKKFVPEQYTYVAPEILAQDENIDDKCDVFSAGIILFEMMAGKLPVQTDTQEQLSDIYRN